MSVLTLGDTNDNEVTGHKLDKLCEEVNNRMTERFNRIDELRAFIRKCKNEIECNSIIIRKEKANIECNGENMFRQKEMNTSKWIIVEKEKENLGLKKRIENAKLEISEIEKSS